MSGGRVVIFWGMLFALAYLYVYEGTYTSIRATSRDPEEAFEFRPLPRAVINTIRTIEKTLEVLSIPAGMLAEKLIDDVDFCYDLAVYYPFIVAIQWFGYGCLFGLWKRRKARAA